MSIKIRLALFGMAERDERVINAVLARYTFKDYSLVTVQGTENSIFEIALVNLESPSALENLIFTRKGNLSNIHIVEVSISGLEGSGQYQIAQRSLLFQLIPMLEKIAGLIVRIHELAQSQVSELPVVRVVEKPAVTPPIAKPNDLFSDSISVQKKSQHSPLKALIVDDSETVRLQLQAALQRIGVTSHSAESGEHALDLLAKNSEFDLMFLDVVMPGEDGYTICKKIRKNTQTRNLRVIMLTSRSSPFDRARGALAGCDTYLTKPIDSKSFYAAVDKAVMKICQNDRMRAASRGYLHAV